MNMNIGLDEHARYVASEHLIRILSNEYFLYLKTLNFHWNITGKNFIALHKLLEEQYEWLKSTIDKIAERIRTLGYTTPASFKKYAKEASIKNENDDMESQTAEMMLENLVITHEKNIQDLRTTLYAIKNLNDYATEDDLIQCLKAHEKNAWMLRSHLLHTPEV